VKSPRAKASAMLMQFTLECQKTPHHRTPYHLKSRFLTKKVPSPVFLPRSLLAETVAGGFASVWRRSPLRGISAQKGGIGTVHDEPKRRVPGGDFSWLRLYR
jgi:hypothetical protein